MKQNKKKKGKLRIEELKQNKTCDSNEDNMVKCTNKWTVMLFKWLVGVGVGAK